MRVLLFGATGSAGGSVLRACLDAPEVEEVRVVARRPPALADPRLKVFVHADYQDYGAAGAAFDAVDACLYCLGVSATQVKSGGEYRLITHDFALAAAAALRSGSPAAAFHFLSGRGASLTGRYLWARVKAETERDLLAGFDAVCWRPAAIDGESSASEPRLFKIMRPILRVTLRPFRNLYVKGEDLGRAMLQAVRENLRARVIENAEIRDLADRSRMTTRWMTPNA